MFDAMEVLVFLELAHMKDVFFAYVLVCTLCQKRFEDYPHARKQHSKNSKKTDAS